ncbi:MAG: hypothetical protein E7Z65_05495 [Thermoplasmata archaeon]|nr:hypothetical protein [Thermoplasmata archaeon]
MNGRKTEILEHLDSDGTLSTLIDILSDSGSADSLTDDELSDAIGAIIVTVIRITVMAISFLLFMGASIQFLDKKMIVVADIVEAQSAVRGKPLPHSCDA